ncbi:condensin complex subunit 3 isoform X1 [Procambarus clarkii]|uniref:condensin complex subunit 3 isoform X1 n=1 Tax=Procambarus clarkii TaxID=6728 RepID=UPI0037432AE6
MKMTKLKQIFSDCQRTVASHPKLVKTLIQTYLKSDFNKFVSEFISLLQQSLIYGDKQPAVERTLNFVAKFATTRKEEKETSDEQEDKEQEQDEEEEEADPFLVNLIQYLLKNHEANSQAVRYRVCQLINKILNYMGEEAVIDDELYNNIYDTMLHRLQDKVPLVRVQAVLALGRLQDPRNKECPVIKAYRYHMCMDPNPDVRRAVLTNIAITFQTLPDILERTRDVRDLVRRQAYSVLSQKVHLRSLTIAQRVRLISEGLKDRSDMVRSCVEKNLIQAWLRMVDGNVLDLLTCLDVEASVTEAELTLKTIFQDVPYVDLIDNFGLAKEERIVSPSDLRPESALYWRCLAQYLRDEGAEEALETVLPELTHFCSYVKDYVMTEVMDTGDEQEIAVHCMEREFATNQLVEMTMLYDLADEVGRRSLDQLVRTLLVSDKVGESLVKGLVKVFGKLHPPTTRINQLAEIISEVREPVCKSVERPLTDEEKRKRKLQAARVKVKINQLREEVEECVRSLDLLRAQMLKDELQVLEADASLVDMDTTTSEEIQEERKDPATLSKCLMIVCHMIENPDVTVMTPTLHSLHENLILLCLRSEDPAVRNQGVKALGLLCLLSKDLAHQHVILFMQISQIDVEVIQLTALKCVIDILHLYGLEEFTDAAEDIVDAAVGKSPRPKDKEEEEYEGEGGAIISALCKMMDNDSVDVRTLAAEGVCKLLLSCRITSSKLLSHLILMWYNPATEDDDLLRHMLGVFFPLYASYGGSNQESLCEAVLPTLQTLFKAPARSPLRDVDIDDMANFLVSITSPSIVMENTTDNVNTHDTLVFTLCTEIMAFPESAWTKVLVRCLNQLHLTPGNFSTLRQVGVLAGKMLKLVKDRVSLNAIERFNASIQSLLKNAPELESEAKNEVKIDATVLGLEDSCCSPGANTPNKTFETTVVRKKRMLYNNQTISDPEVFSSEESDVEGSPMKRLALSSSNTSLGQESVNLNSPPAVPVQENNDPEAGVAPFDTTPNIAPVTVVIPPSDTEFELTPKVGQDDNVGSSDLFSSANSSPQLFISTQHQEANIPNTSKPSKSAMEYDSENSTSSSSRRRRSKLETSTGDTSEEETVLPPKVSRTSRITRGHSKGRFQMSVPSPEKSSDNTLDTSSDSISQSSYLTPPSQEISSASFTTPVENISVSDLKLAPKEHINAEKTVTPDDSSMMCERPPRQKAISRSKSQANARETAQLSKASQNTYSTRTRSQASTPSDDTTPVRRSTRIESSSVSTDSEKTPTNRRLGRTLSSRKASDRASSSKSSDPGKTSPAHRGGRLSNTNRLASRSRNSDPDKTSPARQNSRSSASTDTNNRASRSRNSDSGETVSTRTRACSSNSKTSRRRGSKTGK